MMTKYLLLDPRYIAYRPAMELPADADVSDSAIIRVIDGVLKFVRERVARSVSMKSLMSLDDRLLRDIGLDRYTLGATVDIMLKGDLPVAPRPTATVYRMEKPEVAKSEETLRPAA